MFPLKNTEAYIHANGYRSTLGKELAARDAEINELGSEIQALTNQLEDEAETRAALGAKNLLPIDLKYLRDNNTTGTWSGNVYTFTNLSATFNSDGTIPVSGTSNSLLTIDLGEFTGLGDVILSGCPSGGSDNTYYLQFYNKTDSQWGQSDYGSGKSVTLDPSKTYKVYLAIRGSVTISPAITFKPMIRLATDADPTYQPYAKTNVELTADVAQLDDSWNTLEITDSNYDSTGSMIKYKKVGNVLYLNVHLEALSGTSMAQNMETTIATLPTGYRPSDQWRVQVMRTAGYSSDSALPFCMVVTTAGKILLITATAYTFSSNAALWATIAMPC